MSKTPFELVSEYQPCGDQPKAIADLVAGLERGEDAPVPPGMPVPKAPREWFNDKQRTAAGLVSSGLLYAMIFWTVLRLCTNSRTFPAAGRSFVGVRLLISVAIIMTLTTIAMVGVFQKGDTDLRSGGLIVGLALVWGTSALLHLVALLMSGDWHRGQRTVEQGSRD